MQSWLGRKHHDRVMWTALLVLMTLGLVFLWIPYCIRMWSAGHYQFFPFVFIAVAMLLWARRGELQEARSPAKPSALTAALLAVVVLAALANLLYSSFTGIVATVVATVVGVYAIFGWSGTRAAAPVLALLIFAVPLPMHWDQSLIVRMQLLASDLASRVLDAIGVIHFRQGVILQTQNTQFLTEEACSGIRSLFSSWAVVAAVGVAMRHRWWRIAINLAQTVLWVMIGNVIRIAAVVALADVAPWLGSGSGHELLGLAVFAFILAMVASTDVALSTLISRELVIPARRESPEGDDERRMPRISLPPFPLTGWPLRTALLALVVLASVCARAQWVRASWASADRTATFIKPTPPRQSDLPVTFAGFEQTQFRHTSRGPNFLWAQDSYIWHYTAGPLEAIISVDMPWNEWHNLDHCYRNIGWKTEATFSLLPDQDSLQAAMPDYRHSELLMRRSGQSGFVIFSAIDRDGQHVAESGLQPAEILTNPAMFASQMAAAVGFGGRRSNRLAADRLPVSTVQLYAESMAPWTDADLERLRELFFQARERLVESKVGSSK